MFTTKAIPTNKSSNLRIIVSRPEINRTRFSIVILTTVTERIRIGIINILFNTKCIVLISLSYRTSWIRKIYNITVSILCIVGILGLIAVPVVILRNKVCTSDVAVSLIELVIDNVITNLLYHNSNAFVKKKRSKTRFKSLFYSIL